MNHQDFSNCCKSRKLFSLLIIALTVFLIVLIVSTIVGISNKVREGRYIGQEIEAKNTITVFGTGEVYAKPDLALITFSVKTEAKTVGEAMEENTERMNDIIGTIKDQGVESKDLKTTGFNIYPRYEYRKVEIDIYPWPPGKRVLVGYEVVQSLQVKIRDLEKTGDIIQAATDKGANQVGNLQFTIDDQDELKKQARGKAIDEAKAKAEEIVSQLDINLVRITNFNESGVIPRWFDYAEALEGGRGGAPQIETGENKIEVTVSITYEIR